MTFECKIDSTIHASLDDLHKHLRKFKVSQKDYYLTYYPRVDKLTGEPIVFKSPDQYLSAHFLNKINARKWYKENPEEAKALSIEILNDRVAKKSLRKFPCEIELVSAGLPNLGYFLKTFGQDKLESETKLKSSFNYSTPFDDRGISGTIIVDTREQTPFKLKTTTVSKKLEFGDYAIEGRETILSVERKSLQDLISSFVTQIERVEKEIIRAKDAGAYLIVLCEESLNTAMNYNFIPYLNRYTKIPPEVLFYNIRDLIQKYDNLQFVFVDGRVAASVMLERILSSDIKASQYDWQYLINHVWK